jgi:probable F420-dependent oxidoreductase
MTADHLADGCLPPLAPLVTAAEAAPGLRVGTLVLNNDFRHPSVLAREAATIDMLTDGRLELGIGAGHAWTEYERNGLAFDPAGTRVARLGESVEILRRLLDGETLTYLGEHHRIDGERCYPTPSQTRVPLLVGGGGKRVLGIAARLADTVGFTGLGAVRQEDPNFAELTGFPTAAVDAQVTWVRHQAADRAEAPEFQALVQGVVVTGTPETRADMMTSTGPFSAVSPAELLATPYVMIGSVEGLVEKLLSARDRWGFSHYTVRANAMDAFAPVVAALAGH